MIRVQSTSNQGRRLLPLGCFMCCICFVLFCSVLCFGIRFVVIRYSMQQSRRRTVFPQILLNPHIQSLPKGLTCFSNVSPGVFEPLANIHLCQKESTFSNISHQRTGHTPSVLSGLAYCTPSNTFVSTSNHNGASGRCLRPLVVSYSVSTSNHNGSGTLTIDEELYLILFLHQTTTFPSFGTRVTRLYLILFLHQTTTVCKLFSQFRTLYLILFLHQTTTVLALLPWLPLLYLILFLHQTTTYGN